MGENGLLLGAFIVSINRQHGVSGGTHGQHLGWSDWSYMYMGGEMTSDSR